MTAMILQENKNATERTELNDTQIQQKSRLQQFLLILDQKEHGGNSLWEQFTGTKDFRSQIRHTNELLSKNKIEEAISYAR